MSTEGKVCLVTGATRGIGKGIALQLGQAGTILYITGRSLDELKKVAKEAEARGAKKAIPLQVDHSNAEEVKQLFNTIEAEQNGNLNLLVNNAYAAVNFILNNMQKSFWEFDPVESWDIINNVGLRNNYICASLAARMMVKKGSGLIVNVSSFGGTQYLFNVAYGVGKCAVDRMTADCSIELKPKNVAVVSICPGWVKTEALLGAPDLKSSLETAESPDFVGKAIAKLLGDENVMQKTGKILLTSELAKEYKFTEDDGSLPGGAA